MFKHLEKKHENSLNYMENTITEKRNNTVKKSCGICKEAFIGTEKVVMEKLRPHMKTMHLHGVNTRQNYEKTNNSGSIGPKNLEIFRKRCNTCKEIVCGNAEDLKNHAKTCKTLLYDNT